MLKTSVTSRFTWGDVLDGMVDILPPREVEPLSYSRSEGKLNGNDKLSPSLWGGVTVLQPLWRCVGWYGEHPPCKVESLSYNHSEGMLDGMVNIPLPCKVEPLSYSHSEGILHGMMDILPPLWGGVTVLQPLWRYAGWYGWHLPFAVKMLSYRCVVWCGEYPPSVWGGTAVL